MSGTLLHICLCRCVVHTVRTYIARSLSLLVLTFLGRLVKTPEGSLFAWTWDERSQPFCESCCGSWSSCQYCTLLARCCSILLPCSFCSMCRIVRPCMYLSLSELVHGHPSLFEMEWTWRKVRDMRTVCDGEGDERTDGRTAGGIRKPTWVENNAMKKEK